ncbi:MAG: hypothetical protein HKM28_03540 [Flavobacteriaceae bacterium]|nr:hypothetical protein [Flavobacteriaceae bacterium]
MKDTYSFGFLFLDEIHHINHFITVAAELSKSHRVHILSYPDKHSYLIRRLREVGGDQVVVEMLKTHPFRALTDRIKNRKHPRKGFWMKYNRNYLLSEFDALIFTDYIHHKLLKYRGDDPKPAFIKFPHGLAGRAYGYKKDLLDFDLHLIYGSLFYENLKEKNLLGNKTVLVGSTKLDAVQTVNTPQLFPSKKPIILYNPHFGTPHSSWHEHGLNILDYFKNQTKYNLIFAPHINLFNKVGLATDRSFVKEYEASPHIFIDLGSDACVDMVYPNMADIYIGDVSSQSYEFMLNPKPCIFINTEKIDYKENPFYPFWQAGQVIEDMSDLSTALENAEKTLPNYIQAQQHLTEVSMARLSGKSATERAAAEIIKLVETLK